MYKITITTTAFSNLSINNGLKPFVVRKDMFRFEPIFVHYFMMVHLN